MNPYSVGHLSDTGGRSLKVYLTFDVDVQIQQSKLERDGMVERIAEMEHELSQAASSVECKTARCAELRDALLKYGWHDGACDFIQEELPCTCGFEDLRKALA